MDCRDLRSQLPTLFDDDLPAARRAALEEHLSGCDSCAAERRRLARAVGALRADRPYRPGAPAPEPAHVDGILAAVARDGGRVPTPSARRWNPWLTHGAAAAAGLLLTVAVGWALDRVGPQSGRAPDSSNGVSEVVAQWDGDVGTRFGAPDGAPLAGPAHDRAANAMEAGAGSLAAAGDSILGGGSRGGDVAGGASAMAGGVDGIAREGSPSGSETTASERSSALEPPRAPARPSGVTDGNADGYASRPKNLAAGGTSSSGAATSTEGAEPAQRADRPEPRVAVVPIPILVPGLSRPLADRQPLDRRGGRALAPLVERCAWALEGLTRAVERATEASAVLAQVDSTATPAAMSPSIDTEPVDTELVDTELVDTEPVAGLVESAGDSRDRRSAPSPVGGHGAGALAMAAPGTVPAAAADGSSATDRGRGAPVSLRRAGTRLSLTTRGAPAEVIPALLALVDDSDPAVVRLADSRLRDLADELGRSAPRTAGASSSEPDRWWRSGRGAVADRVGAPEQPAVDSASEQWSDWWLAVASDVERGRPSF